MPFIALAKKGSVEPADLFIETSGLRMAGHSYPYRMRVILIHGFNASPETNFHPWLRDELRDRGFDVVVPALGLRSDQELDLSAIIEEMKKQIGDIDANDILLGHSLGALLVLQYLQAVEMTETPRAVVLVAAPWKVSKPELRRLFMADLDADVTMWKAREFAVVHSKDDTLVPIEHGRKLAESLKARFIERDGDDHYMASAYPILRDLVVEISKTPVAYAPGVSLANDFENVALSDRVAPISTKKPDWMT
jgi:predicted alpha/beta hydrolase family esterase